MQTCTQDLPEPSGDLSSQFTRDFPHMTFPSVSAESPSSWGTPQSRDSPPVMTFTFLAAVLALGHPPSSAGFYPHLLKSSELLPLLGLALVIFTRPSH